MCHGPSGVKKAIGPEKPHASTGDLDADRVTRSLTTQQQRVVERLNFVGMEQFAEVALAAWRQGNPYPCKLTPAERATMEGAGLCEDFKKANAEARLASGVVG